MVNTESLKELMMMKKANEITIAGLEKVDNNLYNKGYMDALKYQNKLIKIRIKAV